MFINTSNLYILWVSVLEETIPMAGMYSEEINAEKIVYDLLCVYLCEYLSPS